MAFFENEQPPDWKVWRLNPYQEIIRSNGEYYLHCLPKIKKLERIDKLSLPCTLACLTGKHQYASCRRHARIPSATEILIEFRIQQKLDKARSNY